MADNVTLPGTGAVVATDDIGGVAFQRVKVAHGADGSATDASPANPLPVTAQAEAADGGTLPPVLYVVGGYDGVNIQVVKTSAAGVVQTDVLSMPTTTVTGPLTDTQLRASAVPVSLSTVPSHAVTDGGGSLTVDAPVGTPVFVRLSDGTNAVAAPQLASGENALATVGGMYATTSGTITSAASTVTSGDISRAGNITIGIFGTYAGVNATFEASPDNGTTWGPVGFTREDSGINETATGVLASNTTRIWTSGSPGFTRIRVRATAWTSGTASVVILPGGLSFEPLVAAVVNPLVASPARTNVAASASSVTLKAANTARKGLIIANAGAATLYVDLTGGTATATTAHSFSLAPGQPWFMDPTTFTTGAITGIWAATGGSGANVTEFTA